MRTFSLALLLLLAVSADAMLRGTQRHRMNQSACAGIPESLWGQMAEMNNLDPNKWAPLLKQACETSEIEGGFKTDSDNKGCKDSATVMTWLGQWSEGDPHKGCNLNEDCATQGGVCFYHYTRSTCTPANYPDIRMYPMCGTTEGNPNLPTETTTTSTP